MIVPIILINFNNTPDTIECLQSILGSLNKNYIVTIVDNSTDNGPVEELLKWLNNPYPVASISDFGDITFDEPIKTSFYAQDELEKGEKLIKELVPGSIIVIKTTNKGFAHANNIGMNLFLQNEKVDWIWLLNNDTVVPTESIQKFYDCVSKLPENVGILSTALTSYFSPNNVQGYYGKYNTYTGVSKAILECPSDDIKILDKYHTAMGASQFVKRSFLKDVGLMSEEYFLYFEEIDWSVRAYKKNWKLAMTPLINIYHKEGSTIHGSADEKSLLGDLCDLVNRIKFTKKHLPALLPFIYGGLILSIANRIRRNQIKRAGLILKYMLNPFKFNPLKYTRYKA